MQIRQLAVPAPRQRHIYGRIVEVLCTWSNGGTGAGRQAECIDREFVTSAKKFPNFNEFSEIKKIRKNSLNARV